ncbi:ATP-binding cassette, subfamily C, CydD [Marinactinospora thermotolerans DSM 45154]|uniref:ATP-binding cassette, subfamily C, CydD n=1 Tax=Marinactinospora thermotolerans DSM 45154 TaxID=1122192 RepID=A0A1T4SF58_9ACTN|nr:thiol reductant ABC exporter subunit CydD [Marinactinospora thermotolerans]SKA26944.1 ATP-binding cassette, subfamily C, CydD [Marinactinospora thermotolerans DSM 45154]
MKPLDPRLVRTARAVRVHLAVTVVCGVVVTCLVLAQAWLLARVISGATDGQGVGELAWAISAVAVVAIARAVLSYGAETAALRSAARAKSELRRRLIRHVTGTSDSAPAAAGGSDSGPVWLSGQTGPDGTSTPRAGELVTLATRGLDALDDYFARYLPQLVLAVLVPVAVLVVVARADWISAAVIAVTLPLIPIFMALVGWHTQARTQRQWRLLNRLGGHFLDVVEGLPTLAIFRRAKAQAAIIRRITDEHRGVTMSTLRIAFLSAFVLELLSTLAVALVAVEIGLRLMYGMLDYETALLVLILAPEAYLPLREVGARFHASMEGVAAAEQVFTVLDSGPAREAPAGGPAAPRSRAGDEVAALPRRAGGPAPRIRFDGVGLVYPGRDVPALRDVDLVLEPGRSLLLTGPSGSGKSSLLALLLRFAEPTTGTILVEDASLAAPVPLSLLSADSWRAAIAWVPQHPYLFDDTVAGNIRLGAPDASDAEVRRAAELAEAHGFISALPDGYATRLGERGARLSAGQRQRVALARAFLRDAPIVLLDEPTAHLDPDNARAVRVAVARLLRDRSGVIVAHDTGWTDIVDAVAHIEAGRVGERIPT